MVEVAKQGQGTEAYGELRRLIEVGRLDVAERRPSRRPVS